MKTFKNINKYHMIWNQDEKLKKFIGTLTYQVFPCNYGFVRITSKHCCPNEEILKKVGLEAVLLEGVDVREHCICSENITAYGAFWRKIFTSIWCFLIKL